ncbi:lipoyl(octanoyl) transferase LipB [Marinobacter sp. M3C]|uniref:lipoyl(octanoyl) transferase LipB n=1 Tax=unclassified Marinobacter TaxID=83889 RepID=UPI00200D81E5|nr:MULTISPECIES: lipoyl(octanoyl) transferase LipB [unclassified Marinobacter]MCL1478086.1 lipoyl(octanoyl) transferase LipB [Marinobacter sp.]MCL1482313.1 lipoyl(octanoyl) transferase LipB [Marinobacter sp.]MCL1485357.1 lipoyl(octanoyl) transferase LipB [Marinobacter sp.]MCL1486502.1 lipoyl(octanoyl) transferase LipB [Marinobacter sp.]UQG56941.1 lipoyl(octanoyl) transferase LipB [Marinobacter sp. M4C]
MGHLIVRSLGEQPYLETWHAMQAFTASRDKNSADELWCLQHPAVYTQGQAGKAEHILAPGDIPVVQVDRGGQVTYHGPGQLVIYLLIDLTRSALGIRALVSHIEQSIVNTLAPLGISAAPRADAPGVYVDGAKIASLGLRVRRGCSFHGLALNVAMDMEPFARINPCGYAGMVMCQVQDFAQHATFAQIEQQLAEQLVAALGHSSTGEGSVSWQQGW